MPMIDRDGVPISYTDTGVPEGAPDAPTVLFGHGLLFSGWMFHPQVAALRKNFRCVTIDWRGQGESPPTSGGYDMDTLTADAAALIETLNVAPVHFAGLSMGGFVGIRLAARRPELLRSLTLLDTSADAERAAEARKYRLLAGVYRLFGIRPVRRRVLPLMFGRTFLGEPSSEAVISEWLRMLSRCDRAGIASAVRGVADREAVAGELASIALPTLVIVGDEDVPTPPQRAAEIADAIPGARLESVTGAGHSSTIERPAQVTALLRDFLL
jgi:3-oxoadipate enol-lactonase